MTILNSIIEKRKGHYCHALEVASAYEIEIAIENILIEFKDTHTLQDLKDFFNSMQIYYYEVDEDGEQIEDKENELEVNSFNVDEFINNNLI